VLCPNNAEVSISMHMNTAIFLEDIIELSRMAKQSARV
jgi:hypothetical protein